VAGADLASVLVERGVADVVSTVLDSPASALACGDVSGPGGLDGQAGNAVADLLAGALAVQPAGVAHGAEHLRSVGEIDAGGGGDACGALRCTRAALGSAVMGQQARPLHEINRRQQPLISKSRACASSTRTARRVTA
jgi:hypothetical protein